MLLELLGLRFLGSLSCEPLSNLSVSERTRGAQSDPCRSSSDLHTQTGPRRGSILVHIALRVVAGSQIEGFSSRAANA